MQTFLPLPDFKETAKVLDVKRLGKQRVECLQIMKALMDSKYGWQNHPATNMWRGYIIALGEYGLAICEEWISRGYQDTCRGKVLDLMIQYTESIGSVLSIEMDKMPKWIGEDRVHSSHRAALLSKMYSHYGRFGWNEKPGMNYYWPV